jgi:hypothetical protein
MNKKYSERMTETMIYLPPALAKAFTDIARELGISKSAFARTSIQHFVDMYRLRSTRPHPDADADDFDYTRIAEAYLRYETGWRK